MYLPLFNENIRIGFIKLSDTGERIFNNGYIKGPLPKNSDNGRRLFFGLKIENRIVIIRKPRVFSLENGKHRKTIEIQRRI